MPTKRIKKTSTPHRTAEETRQLLTQLNTGFSTLGPIAQLVGSMSQIDISSPQAEMNATSISDNRGQRIELNIDSPQKKGIKE